MSNEIKELELTINRELNDFKRVVISSINDLSEEILTVLEMGKNSKKIYFVLNDFFRRQLIFVKALTKKLNEKITEARDKHAGEK